MALSPDFRVEFPRLRTPIALIIDDPAPYVNHLYYLKKELNRDYPDHYEEFKEIPNDFLEDFIALVKEQPVKGKFSVVPNPAGKGYISVGIEGYPEEGVKSWISRVKEELTEFFDITPEMLTHVCALDLKTNTLLPMHEQEWARTQTAESLIPYIVKSLLVLKSVGFNTDGVTSPGAFGTEVEADYADAVLEAVKKVSGARLAWYFLHIDHSSKILTPRLVHLDRHRGEAVVSIVSGNKDIIWETSTPKSRSEWNREKVLQNADYYVTADGEAGRLVELHKAGSFIVFHTHWNSLWSNNARHGLAVLREVLDRINTLLGERVLWMKLSDIAQYYAASKALEAHLEEEPGLMRLLLDNPFLCVDLTVSFTCNPRVSEVNLSKAEFRSGWDKTKVLEKATRLEKAGSVLKPNTWLQTNHRTYICFDNRLGNHLELTLAPNA